MGWELTGLGSEIDFQYEPVELHSKLTRNLHQLLTLPKEICRGLLVKFMGQISMRICVVNGSKLGAMQHCRVSLFQSKKWKFLVNLSIPSESYSSIDKVLDTLQNNSTIYLPSLYYSHNKMFSSHCCQQSTCRLHLVNSGLLPHNTV